MKPIKILTVTALFATFAFAQTNGTERPTRGTPPDPAQRIAMRVDFLSRALTLTDAQKTQITSILTSADALGQSVHTSLQTTSQSLADAVKKNDLGSIDQLSAILGTLTGQIAAIAGKANASIYALLTPEQQAKYPVGRGPGGPGGFGGPGPMGRGFGPMGRGGFTR